MMNRKDNFVSKIARFIRGRNGMDRMAKDFYVVSVVLLIANLFLKSGLIHLLALLCIGYSLFRFLSRSVNKRMIENRKYMVVRNQVFNSFRFAKRKWVDRKDYRYYTCKKCGQKVRVPTGKGEIEITCPRCGDHFTKRT